MDQEFKNEYLSCKPELMNMVGEYYDKLIHLWSLYGFTPVTIDKRNATVFLHTKDLFVDMVAEEEKRMQEKRNELQAHQDSVTKLCRDLEETPRPLESTTLIQQCEEMIRIESQLKERKAEKMKEFIELKETERTLREELGEQMSDEALDFDGIPGKEHIQGLKKLLDDLRRKKSERIDEFSRIQPEIKKLLGLLERDPSNDIEEMIMDLKEIPAVLSEELMEQCQKIEKVLLAEVELNRAEDERLRDEIVELQRRLKDEPEALAPPIPQGYTPSILLKVKEEHTRLTQLKMSNLATFIQRIRTEIEQLAAEVLKKPLLPESVDPTENCLELHESILEGLKTYQVEHKKIIELWRKRQGLWNQMLDYEAKADDPNRLNNRGGTLLKEEKIRKGLEKSLPKLEKEIIALAKTCPTFLVFDMDVEELIEDEREKFNKDKEEKKQTKKQQTQTATSNAMNTTRKRPMTPGCVSGLATPGSKRGKMMTITPVKPSATPKRALRSSTSKDNLIPSPTYSEFTSYKQIFQSTMNEPKSAGPQSQVGSAKAKTPTKGRVIATPRMAMQPREIKDKF